MRVTVKEDGTWEGPLYNRGRVEVEVTKDGIKSSNISLQKDGNSIQFATMEEFKEMIEVVAQLFQKCEKAVDTLT